MAIDSRFLPDSFRRCMVKDDRKAFDAPTDNETLEKAAAGEEGVMHRQFEAWCSLNHIPIIHSRTDKKPTIEEGHPDFTILYDGRGCCVEFKTTHGKLSAAQIERIAYLATARVPTLVAYSLGEAITFVKGALRLV